MNEWTPFLAAAVVIAHCVVIFWPRKPLAMECDENGFPILWKNDEGARPNVACIWDELETQERVAPSVFVEDAHEPSMPSFSHALHPLKQPSPEQHRSVA